MPVAWCMPFYRAGGKHCRGDAEAPGVHTHKVGPDFNETNPILVMPPQCDRGKINLSGSSRHHFSNLGGKCIKRKRFRHDLHPRIERRTSCKGRAIGKPGYE